MSFRVHPIDTGMSWCYLIEGKAGMVLVDAGAPGRGELIHKRLRELGRDDLRLIYITHAHLDHYGSADELRRLTGAPIAVHEADVEAMSLGETRLGSVRWWGHLVRLLLPFAPRYLRPPPTAADVVLRDGDTLEDYGIRGEVLHTPGHTVGSTSLFVDDRLLFVGDLVSYTMWPHPQMLYAHDWEQLYSSIRRLQRLAADKAEWVYSGHGRRVLTGSDFSRIKIR